MILSEDEDFSAWKDAGKDDWKDEDRELAKPIKEKYPDGKMPLEHLIFYVGVGSIIAFVLLGLGSLLSQF